MRFTTDVFPADMIKEAILTVSVSRDAQAVVFEGPMPDLPCARANLQPRSLATLYHFYANADA